METQAARHAGITDKQYWLFTPGSILRGGLQLLEVIAMACSFQCRVQLVTGTKQPGSPVDIFPAASRFMRVTCLPLDLLRSSHRRTIELYNVTYPAEVLHGYSGVRKYGEVTGLTAIDGFIGLCEGPEKPPCYLIGYEKRLYRLIGGLQGRPPSLVVLKLCVSFFPCSLPQDLSGT